jgi:hypothetical protein
MSDDKYIPSVEAMANLRTVIAELVEVYHGGPAGFQTPMERCMLAVLVRVVQKTISSTPFLPDEGSMTLRGWTGFSPHILMKTKAIAQALSNHWGLLPEGGPVPQSQLSIPADVLAFLELADREIAKTLEIAAQRKSSEQSREIPGSLTDLWTFAGFEGRGRLKAVEALKGGVIRDVREGGGTYWFILSDPNRDDSFRRHIEDRKKKSLRGKTRKSVQERAKNVQ